MASILNATTSSGLVTSADNSGSLQLATNNGTTAVTIDTSQNVLVGATTSQGKITAKTADVTSGSTDFATKAFSAEINFSSSNKIGSMVAGYDGSIFGAAIGCSYNGTGYNMQFATNDNTTGNPIERMSITSAGDVKINTTTGVFPLSIQGRNGSAPLALFTGASAGLGNDLIYFYSEAQGAFLGYIGYNGSIVTYNATSDYRLKDNVVPMTGALNKVQSLKPVTYTWKSNNANGHGFIAHELAEVFPDAVSGEKDAVETFTDEDGKEQTRIRPQGIDTSILVATLTSAIQELNAKVDAQALEIQALKGVA